MFIVADLVSLIGIGKNLHAPLMLDHSANLMLSNVGPPDRLISIVDSSARWSLNTMASTCHLYAYSSS